MIRLAADANAVPGVDTLFVTSQLVEKAVFGHFNRGEGDLGVVVAIDIKTGTDGLVLGQKPWQLFVSVFVPMDQESKCGAELHEGEILVQELVGFESLVHKRKAYKAVIFKLFHGLAFQATIQQMESDVLSVAGAFQSGFGPGRELNREAAIGQFAYPSKGVASDGDRGNPIVDKRESGVEPEVCFLLRKEFFK